MYAFTSTQMLVCFAQVLLLLCDCVACAFYPVFVCSFASLVFPSLPWADEVQRNPGFSRFLLFGFSLLSGLLMFTEVALASQHVPRNQAWDIVHSIAVSPMFSSAQ